MVVGSLKHPTPPAKVVGVSRSCHCTEEDSRFCLRSALFLATCGCFCYFGCLCCCCFGCCGLWRPRELCLSNDPLTSGKHRKKAKRIRKYVVMKEDNDDSNNQMNRTQSTQSSSSSGAPQPQQHHWYPRDRKHRTKRRKRCRKAMRKRLSSWRTCMACGERAKTARKQRSIH